MAVEWRQAVLADLGPIVTGKTPATENRDNYGGDVPFITPSDMNGCRYISATARSLTERGAESVRSSRIPSGAVLVSCIGSDMGKAAIAPRPSVTNQQINSIIVEPPNNPIFVYYNLSRRRQEIRQAAGGSAQPILNKSAFGRLPISLPSPKYQRSVAHILGSIDDKIESSRKTNATLEAMARTLFKSWFVDFDPVRAKAEGRAPSGMDADTAQLFPSEFVQSEFGRLPKGWTLCTLGDVIEIHDARRVPLSSRERAQRRGSFPYYGATSVMDHVDDFLFEGRFVLVGEDGSVVTPEGFPFTQYVWGRFWVNNHAHVLTGLHAITQEHLYLLLRQTSIAAFVTGAVQAKLSQGNMKRIPLVAAPDAINRQFGALVEPIFARLRILAEESRTLTELRDDLLPRLLSGEIHASCVERVIEEVV